MTLVCLGLGYSARALLATIGREGASGSARTQAGVDALTAQGYDAFVFGGDAPSADLGARLQSATHLLISAAPDERGDPVLRHHGAGIAAAPLLRWVGYLSTIAVYGDQQGAWVDETTPVAPVSGRAKARVAAERAWLDLCGAAGIGVQVFRIAGIYGPGRSTIAALRAGRAHRIVKPGQVFNRIHVEDIAQVLAHAIEGRGKAQIYNLADDEPAPPQDVVEYAASLLGIEPPPELPFESADLSPMARSFYGETKRVRNTLIKQDLGVSLKYPTYREGLRSLL